MESNTQACLDRKAVDKMLQQDLIYYQCKYEVYRDKAALSHWSFLIFVRILFGAFLLTSFVPVDVHIV